MNQPVQIDHTDDGMLVVSSETIAEGSGVQHKNVLELIESNRADFEEFGHLAFETRDGYNNHKVRFALLNEQQATLLMTFQRNTEQVRTFKKALVKAFFEMAAQLQRRRELTGPELMAAALIEAAATIEAKDRELAGEIKARHAMESYAKELEPRADNYDRFISGDGTYSIGAVAKMIGWSQNKLWAELRNVGVMIAKGAMRNTPYQKYMHHFAVKAYDFTRSDGTVGTSYTTRVQPSGITFISRKTGRVIHELAGDPR